MSRKRTARRASCSSKARYATSAEADAAIRALRARKGCQGRLHPFCCPICGAFHVGHGRTR
ncbi:MAG: hypothetical protein E6Q67_04935 [Roseateles sp.]|nr:MAG: hypothetical protein E6Q67_04935 [Roseateles sp.]